MRICAPCFARIRDDQGRYCLLVNGGRLKHKNERVLSPVGGGLEFTPQGQAFLASLGSTDFEGANDLRFCIPDHRLQDVINWFMRRTQRETSVMRELTEELTDEAPVLSASDISGATERFVGFRRFDGLTSRITAAERETAYLIEVFDVLLPPPSLQKLLAAAARPISERLLYFVTAGEIAKSATREGVAIGPISRTLIS